MAKVITFSRTFQKGHPREGEKTNFVEKFWNSFNFELEKNEELIHTQDLFDLWDLNPGLKFGFVLSDFLKTVDNQVRITTKKNHTIRSGNRFKKGDFFSPRVWSGKPYNSKQIIINEDTLITDVYDFEILENSKIYINQVWIASFGSENCSIIAENDGLDSVDFQNWFSKLPFKGQIICWNKKVKYC
ncbi:hypothetical protein [Flavobacterium sp. 14A]|uniref:hypothetical protein n=1 Tax=Flavobacterium sp. 14A TaxID=2735896 RepID=UPI0015714C96|nr:hypothetical protein [Flavobacterium sp. 14A]NRT11511.1 hypothetical protein [Flavobacterium sp. 14A]